MSDFINWFISEWSAWIGIFGTILGLWISYKLRGHPLLSYKVIKPTAAIPGMKVRFQPMKRKDGTVPEQMQFTATLANVGTERIERPSTNEGGIGITCAKGWKFVEAAYTDSNGRSPDPTFRIHKDARIMNIDFKALEPSQWVEFTYTVARTSSKEHRVKVPAITGYLKGSLSGVRNVRSGQALLRHALVLSGSKQGTLIASALLTTILGYWIMGFFHPDSSAWSFVLGAVAIGFVAYKVLTPLSSIALTLIGLAHPPLMTFVEHTAKGYGDDEDEGRLRTALEACICVISLTILAVAALVQGTGAIDSSALSALLVFALVALVAHILFEVMTYNPTKPVTNSGFNKLIGSSILTGWILSLLAALIIVSHLNVIVATSIYLVWIACSHVLLMRNAQRQGARRSNAGSLYTGK